MLRPRQYVSKSPHRKRTYRRSAISEPNSIATTIRRAGVGIFLFLLDSSLIVWISIKLWGILCIDPDFVVSRINIQGAKSISPDEIIRKSGIYLGQNIFKADIRQARRILNGEPLLRNVEISRQLPREIFIKVSEREPVAQVIFLETGETADLSVSSKILLVDSDGICVSEPIKLSANEDSSQKSSNYPLIQVFSQKKGFYRGLRIIDSGLSRALKVLDIFSSSILKKLLDLERIEVPDESNVVLKCMSGLVVHLGSEDYENRMIRLLSILEDLKKKNQVPHAIDLRFRYVPVVLNEEDKKKHEV